MNKQLQLKRDENAEIYCEHRLEKEESCVWVADREGFKSGYDQCLKDVIELLGEFYADEFWDKFYSEFKVTRLKDTVPSAIDGADWQHLEMMKKLRGDV